jgi:glucose-1-phosphate thymidylyltransferase
MTLYETSELVGLIPAAGVGSRLHPYRSAKELLSVGYRSVLRGSSEGKVPKVVSEYTISAMAEAGAENILFVISYQKLEIFKYFGSGAYHGMNFSYLCQEMANGMPGALNEAYPWIRNKIVLMGMPDTILEPQSCFKETLRLFKENDADLSLGVFPTITPQLLAPVWFDPSNNRVLYIQDKPKETKLFNSWGIAVWNWKFSNFLHDYVTCNRSSPSEMLLTDIFNLAVKNNMKVFARFFPGGRFFDVGTSEGLMVARSELEYPIVNPLLMNER